MYVTRHDANFCSTSFTRCDDAWAVWTNQTNTWTVFNISNCFDHIQCRDSFSNTNNYAFTFDEIKCISRFHNCFSSVWWWYIDDRCISIGCVYCISHAVPNRIWLSLQFNGLSTFSRCASAYDVGAVFNHFIGMEHALLSSDSLHQYFCIFFNPN